MPVSFGLILQPGWRALDPPDVLAFNRKAIALLTPAFTTLWTEDHLQKGASPALEAWTTLAFLAAEHPLYRLGNVVLCQNFRNPALLAKMSATLQYLSSGRLTVGIGAGWQEDEYLAYGYAFPAAGDRVEQLRETIQLLRVMWTQAPATYSGKHYRVANAYCEPRPNPAPPIVVGASGPRMMRIVAELADGWCGVGAIEVYRPRHESLQRACDASGRDIATVERVFNAHVLLTDDSADYEQRRQTFGSETMLFGPTPSAMIAQLEPYLALGVTHFALKPHTLETVERLVADVTPHVAGA